MIRPFRGTLLLALSASSVGAWAQPLPDGADACLTALTSAEAARDFEAGDRPTVGRFCPEFTVLLLDSDWGPTLPDGATEFYGADELESLIDLVARYEIPSRPGPDAADLTSVVADLEPFEPEPEPSLLERLRDWIDGWLGEESAQDSWLEEWLRGFRIPEEWTRYLIFSVAAITVLLLLGIVINELRVGGIFLRNEAKTRRAHPIRDAARAARATLADRDGRPLSRQIELTFAAVAERIQQRYRNRLPANPTHRELARRLGELDADAHAPFARLADSAERVTYADWEPDPASGASLLTDGESLLRRLGVDPEPAR